MIAFIIFWTSNYFDIVANLDIEIFIGVEIYGVAYNNALAFALYYAGKIQKSDIVHYIIAKKLGGSAVFYAYKKCINKALLEECFIFF